MVKDEVHLFEPKSLKVWTIMTYYVLSYTTSSKRSYCFFKVLFLSTLLLLLLKMLECVTTFIQALNPSLNLVKVKLI